MGTFLMCFLGDTFNVVQHPAAWECHTTLEVSPVLSTIEMSPGYGFTMPKKKFGVSSCPEIPSYAAQVRLQRVRGFGVGARGKGQRPLLAPRCRSALDFQKRQAAARDS